MRGGWPSGRPCGARDPAAAAVPPHHGPRPAWCVSAARQDRTEPSSSRHLGALAARPFPAGWCWAALGTDAGLRGLPHLEMQDVDAEASARGGWGGTPTGGTPGSGLPSWGEDPWGRGGAAQGWGHPGVGIS